MSRNRKRYSKVRSSVNRIVTFTILLLTIAACGIFYNLALRNKISALSRDIASLEKQSRSLDDDRIRAQTKWAAYTDPKQLEAALLRHGLHMVRSGGEKIVRINESAPTGPLTPAHTGVASYESHPSVRR